MWPPGVAAPRTPHRDNSQHRRPQPDRAGRGSSHSRGAWDAHVLDDPRVISLWDGSRLAGRWFADHSIGGLGARGDIVWDAYLAFGKNSRWRSQPSDVLASGSDIIDNTSGLEQRFIPLLTRS